MIGMQYGHALRSHRLQCDGPVVDEHVRREQRLVAVVVAVELEAVAVQPALAFAAPVIRAAGRHDDVPARIVQLVQGFGGSRIRFFSGVQAVGDGARMPPRERFRIPAERPSAGQREIVGRRLRARAFVLAMSAFADVVAQTVRIVGDRVVDVHHDCLGQGCHLFSSWSASSSSQASTASLSYP
jgi:hypothetical protein